MEKEEAEKILIELKAIRVTLKEMKQEQEWIEKKLGSIVSLLRKKQNESHSFTSS